MDAAGCGDEAEPGAAPEDGKDSSLTKALVCYAVGSHEELLEIAMPSFVEFADRHGYEIMRFYAEPERPASWMKIPALQAALAEHDEALWVDADVVITDTQDDFPIGDIAWQSMAVHHTSDGEVPNLGVWRVRQRMLPFLAEIWGMEQYVNHFWWEQRAMLDLLGYTGPPMRPPAEPTNLFARTTFLGPEWNRHLNDQQPCGDRIRFFHATMYADRAAAMRLVAGDLKVAA